MSATDDDNWEVAQWLKSFGLQQYTGQFLDNGYETKKLCSNLKAEDLNEMNIKHPLHRDIIFKNSEQLRTGEGGVMQSPSLAPPNGEQYSTVFDDTESNNFTSRWKHGQPNKSPKQHKKMSSPDMKSDLRKKTSNPDKPEGIKPPRQVRRSPSSPARTVHPVVVVKPKEPMTKLELKLKIREQITKDNISVTSPPYVKQDGSVCDNSLIELAEKLADELDVESLTVHDALLDVWRYFMNKSSEHIIPKTFVKTPPPPTVEGQSNYSEPFDSVPQQTTPTKVTSPVKKPSPSPVPRSISVPPKRITLPRTSVDDTNAVDGNYMDPFDALNVEQPVLHKKSPERKPKPPPKPSFQSKTTDDVKHTSSTLPIPASPSLSTHSNCSSSSEEGTHPQQLQPKKSPKMAKLRNPFRRSSKNTDKMPQLKESSRHSGSLEELAQPLLHPAIAKAKRRGDPCRQSLPIDDAALNGIKRSISSNPALLYHQAVQEYQNGLTKSQKKLSGSLNSIDQLHKYTQSSPPSSYEVSDPEASPAITPSEKRSSRVKAINLDGRCTSELELSTMLEVYVDGSSEPIKFRKAQSNEMLDLAEEEGRQEGQTTPNGQRKKNILSRFFKKKSKAKSLQKTESELDTLAEGDGKNGLTLSQSMPDIAQAAPATVHSEYTEIFDTGRTLPVNMSPPKLPSRARPHSHKPISTSLSNNTTPNTTPSSTPITHHKIMIKSDSSSSNEILHSITSSNKGGDDDVIDVTVYDKPWESRVPKSPHWNRSPKKQTSMPMGKSETPEKEGTEAWSIPIHVESAKDSSSSPTSRVIEENKPLSNPISPDLYPSLKPLKSRIKPRSLTRIPTPIDRLEPLPKNNDLPTKDLEDKPNSTPPSGPSKAINIYSVIAESDSSKQTPPKPARQSHATKLPSLEAETISSDKEEEPSSSESATSSPAPTANSDSLKRMKQNSSFVFTSGALLYNAVERMLEDEGIDLTSPPYSSSRGEYGIPSALVSRYAEEVSAPEEEIVKTIDKIRRTCLIRAHRGHIPLKKDWKRFSDIKTSSIESFMTSVGMPQYNDTLYELGYSSVLDIRQLNREQFYALPLKDQHKRRLSVFTKLL